MRPVAAILILALLAAVPSAAAQAPTFDEAYQVRAAVGDIPTTAAGESSGYLNVEQRLTVDFSNQSAAMDRTYTFFVPAGASLVRAACNCTETSQNITATKVDFTIGAATPSGRHTITVLTRQSVQTPAAGLGVGTAFGFVLLASPDAPADRAVILYVPNDHEAVANVGFDSPGATTDGSATIQFARFDASNAMPEALSVAVVPASTVPSGGADGADGMTEWLLPALLGVVLGAILWSLLVSRGVVQKRTRKQVVATAAHVEAAATDPPAVLEGKKRALLAALKEVELAKQANEMPVEVYDVVKADLKKQAVTVMRALEAGSGETKA